MKRRLLLYGFVVLAAILLTNCGGNEHAPTALPIVLNEGFPPQGINHRVLYSTDFSLKQDSGTDLPAFIKTHFKANHTQQELLFGFHALHPEAWIYTEMVNVSDRPVKIVITETNHSRCDGMEVFRIDNNHLQSIGRITRTTPIPKRSLTNFDYAVPLTINALDTANVLIRTQRFRMMHEVGFQLSGYEKYLENNLFDFFSNLFLAMVVALCALVLLIVGGLFFNRVMLSMGVWFVVITLMFICYFGFFDTLPFYAGIGLTAANVHSFAIFLTNAIYHPAERALLFPALKKITFQRSVSNTLFSLNVLTAVLYLLPVGIFDRIEFVLPYFFTVLTLLNIGWIFYMSILVYVQAKIVYFLMVAVFTFIPLFYSTLSKFLTNSDYGLVFNNSYQTVSLGIIAICVLTIYRFSEELVSKKKANTKLQLLNESLEQIRRSEIETIGRNLHDEVGNTLASALGYLDMKELKVATVKDLILGAINELRFISHNLVKDDNRALSERVTALIERFNDATPTNFVFIDFSRRKMDLLPVPTRQNMYNIIQELLTNIAKHAQAEEAQVQFFEIDNILRIVVEDDGIGFDPQHVSRGIGLQNISKRAALMKGHVTIDSTPQGTTTIIDLTP